MTRQQGRLVHTDCMVAIIYGVRMPAWGHNDPSLLPDVDIDELAGLVDFDDLRPPAGRSPLPSPPPVA